MDILVEEAMWLSVFNSSIEGGTDWKYQIFRFGDDLVGKLFLLNLCYLVEDVPFNMLHIDFKIQYLYLVFFESF